MSNLQAFHNNPKIKAKYLKRVRNHIKADNLIKGVGWENGKGCAVGCTLESYDHYKYETELGIPLWLARVEDNVFEGMSLEKSKSWPEKFLKAIKPGVNLDKVKAPFMIFILKSTLDKFDHKQFPDVLQIINKVIDLYENDGTKQEFEDIADTAAAAADAAYADTAAAAADAAYAAAAAAPTAATAAAANAAAAAYIVTSAAYTVTYDQYADYLLKLLKECK